MNNELDKARKLLEKGCIFYEQKNLTRAATLFQQAAALGSSEAKVNLGNMYCEGKGVAIDLSLAKNLYRSAFKEGCVYGASALGVQYETEGKLHLAEKWLKRAIEMGDEWSVEHLKAIRQRQRSSRPRA